ncbi:MAG: holo-ACP synthase [Candidatus Omnitrophica bacterium]|nr:holo-ACP synthase [Candidatus Omnitrophota bacterium]MCM8792993.1 holo-ACP synthase [Candidatus Omnitrophota bacterium]
MKIETGIDLIETKRIKKALNRWGKNFLERIFTEREQDYVRNKKFYFENLAARFAAKEAVFKAIGNLKLSWQDIEILNNGEGKPVVFLSKRAKRLIKRGKIKEIKVSLTHTRNYAVAQAIVVSNSC